MNCDQIRPMLGAYVDGELDAVHSSSVSTHLTTCADCRAKLESFKALQSQVRAVPRHSLSSSQREKLGSFLPAEPSVRSRPGWFRWYGLGALSTAMVWLVFAFLIRPENPGVNEMLNSHVRALIPGHLVDVQSSDHHTVKPWFAGKVSVSPITVDLKEQGFPLLGGRIDMIDRRPTPVLVFGHGAHVLSVFVFPTDHSIKVGEMSKDGYQATSWIREGLEYVAVTDMDRGELQKFVDLYRAVN